MAGKELRDGKKSRDIFGGKQTTEKIATTGKIFWREHGISPYTELIGEIINAMQACPISELEILKYYEDSTYDHRKDWTQKSVNLKKIAI